MHLSYQHATHTEEDLETSESCEPWPRQQAPGGRGGAGGLHCYRIDSDKYHPGHSEEVGMRHDYLIKSNQSFCPTVNLDQLWALLSEQTRVNAAENKTGAASVVNVVRSGYYKVPGKGNPLLSTNKVF